MRKIVGLVVLAALAVLGQSVTAQEIATVEANGTTITYVDEGSGEPVVFLHGGLADLRTWAAIQPLIAAKHRFIALNLRYFGEGDWPDDGANFTADTHIADVAAFVEALGTGPVHLVGWSFGADVATGVALTHPDLIQTLTVFEPTLGGLVDAGSPGDAARAEQGAIFGPVVEALQGGDVDAATKRSVEGVLGMEPGGFDALDEGFRMVFLQNARTLPLWLAMPGVPVTCEALRTFDKPSLVIHSDAGRPLFDHIAQSMAGCLLNGKLVKMEKSNHAGPAQHPDVMAALIETLIAGS